MAMARFLICMLSTAGSVALVAKPPLSREAIVAKIEFKKTKSKAVFKNSELDTIVADVCDYARMHAPQIAKSHGETLIKAQRLYNMLGSKATRAELDAFAVLMEKYRNEAHAEATQLKKSITTSKNKRYAAELIAETFELYRAMAEKRINLLEK